MKKRYIIPETDIVELDERLPLLAGSINESLQDEEEIVDPTLII